MVNTGYAVCDQHPDGVAKPVIVEGGVVKTSSKDSLVKRLTYIHSQLREVAERLRPDEAAIEDLHSVASYAKTSILMGHARGAAFLAVGAFGIPVFEYQPTNVKQITTGFGRATKRQIQDALVAYLEEPAIASNEHVADALAVALCHLQQRRALGLKS